MKIGYVRVSTKEQNTARQDIIMEQLGVEKIFVDKLSGKDTQRPQLQEMLSFVREGDVLVVESISRLARSTRDLLKIIDALDEKKVKFISQKENFDTSTSQGKFVLTMFAALAELEREMIAERRDEGIAAARASGKSLGRPKIEIDWTAFEKVYKEWSVAKITAVEGMKRLDLKPNTFYSTIKEYEQRKGIKNEEKSVRRGRRKLVQDVNGIGNVSGINGVSGIDGMQES